MEWTTNPGGKRYRSGRFEIVRQNTAAGAARWKATWTHAGGTTYVIAKTQYLADARRACEASGR